MFEEVMNVLDQGKVICPFTYPRLYDHLKDEKNLAEVNAYVGRVGKEVESPNSKEAFFLVYKKVSEFNRGELSALHKRVLGEIKPVVDFFKLYLSATGSDILPVPGQKISKGKVYAALEGSAPLRSDLASLVSISGVSGSTDQDRLDKVFNKMESWGYLVVLDKEIGTYHVTGALEIVTDMIDFFLENTHSASEYKDKVKIQGEFL